MSLLAMNSLYKNHVPARSSRQSRCVATSRHVHFLSLFVSCYIKCFIARKVGSAAIGKVKTFADKVLGLL